MRSLPILGAFLMLFGATQTSSAGSTEFYRISTTVNGSSGLFITQSIDTLAPGKVEVGLGILYEKGATRTTDLSVTEFSSTLTIGVTPKVEIWAQVPYFSNIKIGATSESDVGDVNLSVKWRLLEPSSELNFPGFAFSFSFFFPSGDRKSRPGAVDSWGFKGLLISSAETEVGFPGNTVLVGFYADAGIHIRDSGDPNQEKHGVINLGLLIPIADSRALQLMLEGNRRVDRNSRTGNEYTGFTAGLRYVTRHAAINGGWQHRMNEQPFEDSDQFIFYGSYFF